MPCFVGSVVAVAAAAAAETTRHNLLADEDSDEGAEAVEDALVDEAVRIRALQTGRGLPGVQLGVTTSCILHTVHALYQSATTQMRVVLFKNVFKKIKI